MDARQPWRSGVGPAAWAIVFVVGVASTSRVAFADPKLQGIGEASLGYTDNIQSAPNVTIPNGTPKSDGAFLILRPAVVLASASARSIHRLKYTYTYDLFFQRNSASSSSNQLEYRGFFDLSPRLDLVVGANAVQSNNYSAITLTAPGAGAVNATPTGSGAFLSATVDELLSADLGPGIRGYEGISITEQIPIFGTVAPRTFAPGSRLGVERGFRFDAIGAEARAEYSLVEGSLRPDGTPLGPQRQIIGTGVALWRHDWGRDFTSRVEAGVLRVERVNTGRGFWEPAGSASLTYVTEAGDAGISYAHYVTTNPLLGQTLLIDEARLRGDLPLTKKGEVLAAASAAYQSGQILDENTTLAARVDVILADVGVGWQVTDLLLLGVRYQHVEQISNVQPPLSNVQTSPLPLSFVRNSVMIGATFRFPPERQMPRAYRAPRRVDRSDEIRDAVEPTEPGSQQRPGGGGR